MLYLQYF